MRFELPFPHKILWPNGRTRNYRYKAAKIAKARTDARFAAMGAGAKAGDPVGKISVTYHPKTSGRVPDEDNIVASFKSYRDGIAAAFGADDAGFDVTFAVGERKPGGRVTVEIGGAA